MAKASKAAPSTIKLNFYVLSLATDYILCVYNCTMCNLRMYWTNSYLVLNYLFHLSAADCTNF